MCQSVSRPQGGILWGGLCYHAWELLPPNPPATTRLHFQPLHRPTQQLRSENPSHIWNLVTEKIYFRTLFLRTLFLLKNKNKVALLCKKTNKQKNLCDGEASKLLWAYLWLFCFVNYLLIYTLMQYVFSQNWLTLCSKCKMNQLLISH